MNLAISQRILFLEMPQRVEYELTEKAKNLRHIIEQTGNILLDITRLIYSKKKTSGFEEALGIM